MSVEPSTVRADIETPAAIRGSDFYDSVRVALNDDEPPEVARGWSVWVDDVQVQPELVRRVSAELLAVTLPSRLPIGVHDVFVMDPSGQSQMLSNALTVVSGDSAAVGGATATSSWSVSSLPNAGTSSNSFATGGMGSAGGSASAAITGGSATAGGASGFGGTNATGGAANIGGIDATGGAPTVGGSEATGGTPSIGGTSATAGAADTGGTNTTGGTPSSGGAPMTGGEASVGGTNGSGGVANIGGTDATGGGSTVGGTDATGGAPSEGGTEATGGMPSVGGTNATGGTSSIGGAQATGGTHAASSASIVEQYCGATPVTDLGTLPDNNQSGPIDVFGTGPRCFGFTVVSPATVFHGIQISNCNHGTVTVNGTIVCLPGTGIQCEGVVSIDRAEDGYWYIAFSPGISTTCQTSWWLY